MWMMAAQTGMSLFQGLGQAKAQKAQYKAQKAIQEWSNKMVALSGALNQNAITNNDILTSEMLAAQGLDIRTTELQTRASAEAQAAAAGVSGRSVSQTMLEIARNAALRESERQSNMLNARTSSIYNRTNVAMAAAMQTDHTVLPKPNTASTVLSALASSAGASAGASWVAGKLEAKLNSSTSKFSYTGTSMTRKSNGLTYLF